ncbi:MAG TPA: LON peptidase substrate-binding domain-containing protein [Phycisphaerae bacterium]|nr:LON peptidase substrate-binding domain-containing protein [Phycisphaerae bacterium]
MSELPTPYLDGPVPLFPLPNVVLFPRAVLPLHIFEPRYRAMVGDALAGQRLIAIALLLPEHEGLQHTNTAPISPVTCVGRILNHEQLEDGKYNIILQGLCRARIRQEHTDGAYREAMMEQMISREPETDSIHRAMREHLNSTISGAAFQDITVTEKLKALLTTHLPLGAVADLVAYAMVQDVEVKQSLLEQLDVVERVEQLVAEIETLGRLIELTRKARGQWPPPTTQN